MKARRAGKPEIRSSIRSTMTPKTDILVLSHYILTIICSSKNDSTTTFPPSPKTTSPPSAPNTAQCSKNLSRTQHHRSLQSEGGVSSMHLSITDTSKTFRKEPTIKASHSPKMKDTEKKHQTLWAIGKGRIWMPLWTMIETMLRTWSSTKTKKNLEIHLTTLKNSWILVSRETKWRTPTKPPHRKLEIRPWRAEISNKT